MAVTSNIPGLWETDKLTCPAKQTAIKRSSTRDKPSDGDLGDHGQNGASVVTRCVRRTKLGLIGYMLPEREVNV